MTSFVMDGDTMVAIERKVKEMRRKAKECAALCGQPVDYASTGEMRGYLKILELLCPDPMAD